MLYSASHITRHFYQSSVSRSLNELRLTPRSLPQQRVREFDISIQPKPKRLESRKDYFGNDTTMVEIVEAHDVFVIEARSIVEVQATSLESVSTAAWEEVRDRIAAHPDDECLEALEFVFDSPFVLSAPELAEFARPTFTPQRPLVDALKELSHRIHCEFRYQPKSTSIKMPLLEVLHNRRGVCQDFAHVMIGALRSLRLAARYTSGYLRSGNLGAEASHAWVSAFVPGSGWLSFDPTNDVMPSDGHVTLAWGRDYGDVTPVSGIASGGGSHSVEVEVSVRAIADTPAEV